HGSDSPLSVGHGSNGPLSIGHGEGNKLKKTINENDSLFEQSEQASLKKQINILRRELYNFAKESLIDPDNSEAATLASFKFKQLEAIQKYYEFLFGAEAVMSNEYNTAVPIETPYFQWRGHTFMNKKFIFSNVDACLTQFENVLESRAMNVETNWKRIIKARMSTGMANWAKEVIKKNNMITWNQFKLLLKSKYSCSEAEERKAAVNQMKSLKLSKFDSIEAFLEKFMELKEQSGITEDTLLVDYLLKGLNHEMYTQVNLLISASRDQDKNTIDAAISYLRSVYELYERDPHFKLEKQRKIDEMKDQVFKQVLEASNRNSRKPIGPSFGSSYHSSNHRNSNHQRGRFNSHQNFQSRFKSPIPGPYVHRHNDRRHRACYDCGFTPFTMAHKNECPGKVNEDRNRNENRNDIVPKPIQDPKNNNNDTDSENEESHQTFAALSINTEMDTDCKLNTNNFSEMPLQSNMSANNPLYLPIILENDNVSVRTWFLLDTGCTFSAISPKLASYLNVKLINKNGIIKLAKNNSVVERKGCTQNEIKITYGNKITSAQFEIFDLFDNLHCVIGMNLLTKIGIIIGNVITEWGNEIGYDIPVIDPTPYKPNETPFGTEAERNMMLQQLEPFLQQNKNISPKAYCTIPDSEITLPVRTDISVNTYRRQFPIAEALRPIVQKQVEKWRDNGIIKPAEPGTPHNSPIFPVRKKNPQGEYAGDCRVVIDCRLINAALDLTKIDRFPLPLISDLHKKMSKHSLYTVIDLSQCFHSFKIKRESRPYLTFTDMNGFTWSFSHCPFGITMISSVAQRILSILFEDLKDQVTNFIDDVTIHTENDLQKHTETVKVVLDRLTRANLRVNTEKMHFAQKSVFILGFCMSEKGLALDPRKVSNILDWKPTVANSRELSSRLGLINFFRSHLPNLSTLTAPLDKLRNVKDIKAVWTQEHSNIMTKLQQLLVNAPVLSTPNLKYDMCLATDSSAFGIGAALYQVIHNKIYYIGFVARRLAPSETRWGSSKRELAAVAYAFQRFHQWLYGRHFHLFVDNTGILYLHSKEKINRMVENFYETIFEMDFDITYCMGMKNILADQLSRIFWPNSLVEGENQQLAIKSQIKEQTSAKLQTNITPINEELDKKQIDKISKTVSKNIENKEIHTKKLKRKEKIDENKRKNKKLKRNETDIKEISNITKERINKKVNNNVQKEIGETINNNNQNIIVTKKVQKGKQKNIKESNDKEIERSTQLHRDKFRTRAGIIHKKWNEKDISKLENIEDSQEINISEYTKREAPEERKELKEISTSESRETIKGNTIDPEKVGKMHKLNKRSIDSEADADGKKDTKLISLQESLNSNTKLKNTNVPQIKNKLNLPHSEYDIYIPNSENELYMHIDKDKTNINNQKNLNINNIISDNISDNNLYTCISHLNVYQAPKNEEEKQNILEKSHILGHFGIHAMETIIHQDLNYHWKGLRDDITTYIRKCHKCQKFNLAKHVYHPPKQEAPGGIMDHVVFDLGTFDCTTPRGNNYILVVLDLFSRFIILRAIPDKTAITVAKELVSVFSLFGYPCIVGHDRGQEFNSILLENILKHAGVENRASLPFTPQGNSCCEAAVKSTKTIIMKMLEGRREDWDLYIDGTALCLNIHRSRLHGMRPFTVMFHREPNEFKDYTDLQPVLPDKEIDVEAFKKKLDLIDRIVVPAIRDQILQTQKKDSTYFRKRHRILENPYPIGATVMIKNIENKNNKTDPNYEGPFYVHGHTRNGSYILVDKTNTFLARDIPTQQLKLISEENVDKESNKQVYEVQAIVKHRGTSPNYEYLTRWKGYTSEDDTWEKPDAFDSIEPIKIYWARVGANLKSKNNNKAPRSLNRRRIPTREDKSRNKRNRLES
ncbi:hypothetical protein INT46_002651, partial [Mucor plumbeus]